MNNIIWAAKNSGVDILFAILAIIVALGLIALLIWSIRRERIRWESEKDDTKQTDNENITVKMEHLILAKQEFSVYCIETIEYSDMIKSLGDLQYESALTLLLKKIKRLFLAGSKICVENDKVYILTQGRVNKSDIEKVCNSIVYETSSALVLGGTLNVYFDIALGVASFPYSGKNVQELMDNIQLALLAAKRNGYNRFVIYDDQLGGGETEEYKNYVEIKEAIKNNEFTLYYQPIVSTDNKEVFAVETLLRWNHKTRGVLSPLVFLNILEQSGDINWVGLWSIEQLIKQKEAWQKSYPDNNFQVSINISQKQIRNKDIVEELRRIIKKHHIAYSQIILEIIEPAALSSEEVVINNINRLSQLGFKIAIDNYGADFISLQKLENLNVSMLKLDKKFFSSTSEEGSVNKGILDLLIGFCNQKDISLVCMGIETEEEIAYAQEKGIQYAQGYYFSKPKSSKEVMQDIILTPWKV